MTTFTAKASLALWQRRLKYRERRHAVWHRRHDPAKAAKWHRLVAEAQAMIRKRREQIAHPAGFKPLEGLDWAWGKANIAELNRHGIRFACRYLSHDASKNLTLAEAISLSRSKIACVVVWETTANRAAAGRDAGASDAKVAVKQAQDCGKPTGSPIYFAVDFDADPSQVAEYFRGVNSVLGADRTGVYGSYRVVKGLMDARLSRYGWQTYAWSGGKWHAPAQIRQYQNGIRIAGVNADRDRAMHPHYGEWRAT